VRHVTPDEGLLVLEGIKKEEIGLVLGLEVI